MKTLISAQKLCAILNATAYPLPLNQGHALEITARSLGYADWNTAAARHNSPSHLKEIAKRLRGVTAENSRPIQLISIEAAITPKAPPFELRVIDTNASGAPVFVFEDPNPTGPQLNAYEFHETMIGKNAFPFLEKAFEAAAKIEGAEIESTALNQDWFLGIVFRHIATLIKTGAKKDLHAAITLCQKAANLTRSHDGFGFRLILNDLEQKRWEAVTPRAKPISFRKEADGYWVVENPNTTAETITRSVLRNFDEKVALRKIMSIARDHPGCLFTQNALADLLEKRGLKAAARQVWAGAYALIKEPFKQILAYPVPKFEGSMMENRPFLQVLQGFTFSQGEYSNFDSEAGFEAAELANKFEFESDDRQLKTIYLAYLASQLNWLGIINIVALQNKATFSNLAICLAAYTNIEDDDTTVRNLGKQLCRMDVNAVSALAGKSHHTWTLGDALRKDYRHIFQKTPVIEAFATALRRHKRTKPTIRASD